MSDQSHSSKFKDVLARMKGVKTTANNQHQESQEALRIKALGQIEASSVQRPKDVGNSDTPLRLESISRETIAPIEDIDMSSIIAEQQQASRVSSIQNQIDSILETDQQTIERIRRRGGTVINQLLRDMIFVRGGTFTKGKLHFFDGIFVHDFGEVESQEVQIPSFFMCKRPLLPQEWELLLDEEAVMSKTIFANVDGGRLPDVMVLCNRLSRATGCQFRLQTEAEHEYAARGGVKGTLEYRYAGSNDLNFVSSPHAVPISNELGFTYMNFACQYKPDGSYERVHGIAEWCAEDDASGYVFKSSDCPVWVRNYNSNKLDGIWREADWCIRLVCDDTPEARAVIENAKR